MHDILNGNCFNEVVHSMVRSFHKVRKIILITVLSFSFSVSLQQDKIILFVHSLFAIKKEYQNMASKTTFLTNHKLNFQ